MHEIGKGNIGDSCLLATDSNEEFLFVLQRIHPEPRLANNMMEQLFELVPFPDPGIPILRITGSAVRSGNLLTVLYSLSGTVNSVLFPSLNPQPGRKNELWMATCFEFFLARPDRPQYWEFNLSPSGDWNVYRLDAYRRKRSPEEKLVRDLRLEIQNRPGCFRLQTVVELSRILGSEKQLVMGVACIIQTLDGHETYWALTHPSPQADFHRRESFILALEA